MESNNKCSLKEHEEINANIYCQECKINMCNKCINLHSGLFKNHHTHNLNKEIKEIFTGLCQEKDHSGKLDYFCKTHNKLCCGACIAKIKKIGYSQHTNCEVYTIEDIKDEKKNNLIKNLKNLEELSLNLEPLINKIKNITEIILKSKEELKSNIQNIFTKIRNCLNEREDQLLIEADQNFERTYFKENISKEIEKLPNEINISLEKGKKINWENIDLSSSINDCINIENNLKEIHKIKDNLKKYDNINSYIKFQMEDLELNKILESIKVFGELSENLNENIFNFRFKEGENYSLSNNGKIATKNKIQGFNCVILGNKEIPKNKISKWKFKINSDILKAYLIGIGPDNPDKNNNYYKNCWTCDFYHGQLIIKSLSYSEYTNNKYKNEILKKGDIIEVLVNRIDDTLSFIVNNKNYGIACTNIPKNETLYPIAMFYSQNESIEIVGLNIM